MEETQERIYWHTKWGMVSKICVNFISLIELIHFSFMQLCIIYKCRYTHHILFLFLYMEHENRERNEINQQNIANNSRTISLEGDEDMEQGRSSSDYNSSNDESWSINLNVVTTSCIFRNFCLWTKNILCNVDISTPISNGLVINNWC